MHLQIKERDVNYHTIVELAKEIEQEIPHKKIEPPKIDIKQMFNNSINNLNTNVNKTFDTKINIKNFMNDKESNGYKDNNLTNITKQKDNKPQIDKDKNFTKNIPDFMDKEDTQDKNQYNNFEHKENKTDTDNSSLNQTSQVQTKPAKS